MRLPHLTRRPRSEQVNTGIPLEKVKPVCTKRSCRHGKACRFSVTAVNRLALRPTPAAECRPEKGSTNAPGPAGPSEPGRILSAIGPILAGPNTSPPLTERRQGVAPARCGSGVGAGASPRRSGRCSGRNASCAKETTGADIRAGPAPRSPRHDAAVARLRRSRRAQFDARSEPGGFLRARSGPWRKCQMCQRADRGVLQYRRSVPWPGAKPTVRSDRFKNQPVGPPQSPATWSRSSAVAAPSSFRTRSAGRRTARDHFSDGCTRGWPPAQVAVTRRGRPPPPLHSSAR